MQPKNELPSAGHILRDEHSVDQISMAPFGDCFIHAPPCGRQFCLIAKVQCDAPDVGLVRQPRGQDFQDDRISDPGRGFDCVCLTVDPRLPGARKPIGRQKVPGSLLVQYGIVAILRDHAQRQDWLLASDGDPAGIVASLTERPAFLTRFKLIPTTLGPAKALATDRFKMGAALQRIRTYEELQRFGREQHVRWFLLLPGDMAAWPAAILDRCQFQSGAVRVFELTAAGPPPPQVLL